MAAAKEQAAAAEERAGKAETNAQITADVDAAGKLEKELAAAARVVHMNVFEDGLTDSPAAVGLPADYTDRLDRLLRALSDDGAGNLFTCFKSARDLGALPPIAPLTSAEALLGVVDLVYNVLYHPLGGEARLESDRGERGLGDPPDLANCLRTLFLCSAVDAAGIWSTPRFEAEIDKALGSNAAAAERIRTMRQRVFDAQHGTLGWDRGEVERIFKRGNNVWHKSWCRDLATFLGAHRAQGGGDSAQRVALATICQIGIDRLPEGGLHSLMYVQLDATGSPLRVTSLTMHSAIRLLLRQICTHSMHNDAAGAALCEFSGAIAPPATPGARADMVAGPLMAEVEAWRQRSSLQERHLKFCETIAAVSPDMITLVEFDAQWRRLPLPSNRPYVSARDLDPPRGTGQATIVFDRDEFVPVDADELAAAGVARPVLPGMVRSMKDQGVGAEVARPKSSCMLLLRRRATSNLVFVAAVHLDSAPPSDTRKVLQRRRQLRALLSEVSLVAEMLLQAGVTCAVALGGDFNATREEFVYGNLPAFFESSATMMVRPPLRPPQEPLSVEALGGAIARIDAETGGLVLLCNGVDRGELVEATLNPAELPGAAGGRVGCTRAGRSVVIDFVFYGTVGGSQHAELAASSSSAAVSSVRVLASDEETRQAADQGCGVRHAVLRWGSDHLPVACDIRV